MTFRYATRPRVDREEELALLTRLARGETSARIALIQAPSGMGKSELLREFKARCPGDPPPVVIDFKGGSLTLADVLFHIYDTLGAGHFSALLQAVQQILQPAGITMSGNTITGQNELLLALGGPDEETRQQRRAQLTTALLADLRALGRVTLIFDTFEKCEKTWQGWFDGLFLPAAHRSPNLAVIVAGQCAPETSTMWEAELLTLTPIAAEHWQEYANAVGVGLTLEFIRGCCTALNGHCLTIAQVIEGQGGQHV